jgi:thioredoxin 1
MFELNDNNFASEVLNSQVPVLVDFWAPWCGPCRMIAPIVDEIASEYEGKMKVAKVNVDDNSNLATKYGVMSIPTVCLFAKGDVVFRSVGVKSKKDLVAQITEHLG